MSDYYSVLRSEILMMLPEDYSLVADIGCGSGITGALLKDTREEIRVIGVELDETAANQARIRLDAVLHMDIEQGLAGLGEYEGKLDLILLLDILEHLRDPWSVLAEIKKLLSSEGVIIASIPNVRNFKVILPLVFKGRWTYTSAGILDRTHLRFFTRESILQLFSDVGLKVSEIKETGPLTPSSVKSAAGTLVFLLNLLSLGLLRHFIAHQYLVRVVQHAESSTLSLD